MKFGTKVILLAVATLAMLPVLALFDAWIMSQIWARTAATQYGAGPTMVTWYGLAVLGSYVTRHLQPKQETKTDKPVTAFVEALLGRILTPLLTLVFVIFVIFAVGW